jgi:hypothetical protein
MTLTTAVSMVTLLAVREELFRGAASTIRHGRWALPCVPML